MITTSSKEIQALVNDIRDGYLLLPELQRQFVWKSTQVRDLFDSLYHQYPSGQLLVWETDDLPYAHAVKLEDIHNGQKRPMLLLDGQQRLTSLAAIMLARPLVVRGARHPIDIVFNVYTEKFEVSGPRQAVDAGWISLSKLFTQSVLSVLSDLKIDIHGPEGNKVFERLARLEKIKTYHYQINILEGLSYDEVTHIFVRINSGGTKLNSADLALAQISSRWRGVTHEIDAYRNEVYSRGHRLWLDTGILLRILSALVAGQTRLSQLFKGERQTLSVVDLEEGWNRTKAALDQVINFLVGNCYINRMDLLPTQYILITLSAYFDRFTDNTPAQIRELQRWTYLALIWSRYSGSSETLADQDIAALSQADPIAAMIQNLEDKVGKHRLVTERDLRDQRKNSASMLMAYVLARRNQAHDWFNGVVIDGSRTLEIHHIFPKEVLKEKYDLKLDSRTVDQVANLVFLSKKANLRIRSQSPGLYLPNINVECLRDQYVPLDSELWNLEQFEEFVKKRREALAIAINHLLDYLSEGKSVWVVGSLEMLESRVDAIESQLRDLIAKRLDSARAEGAWEMIPSETRRTVEGRIASYISENPYQRDYFVDLESKLKFCQFSDYQKIMRSNWVIFQQEFGDQAVFDRHFNEVVDVRNSLKHNRDLTDSKLASAEAGLLWLESCLNAAIHADEDEEEDENGDEDIVEGDTEEE